MTALGPFQSEFRISDYFRYSYDYNDCVIAPYIECWVDGETIKTDDVELIFINDPGYHFDKRFSKPENRKGKDFLIYLSLERGYLVYPIQAEGGALPESRENGRIVAGFHTLCADIPKSNSKDYPDLNGATAGSIIPQSIWDLVNRPKSPVRGMVQIPRLGSWISIYIVSQFVADGEGYERPSYRPQFGKEAAKITYMAGCERLGVLGYRLPSKTEFRVAALGTPQGECVQLIRDEDRFDIPDTGGNTTEVHQEHSEDNKRLVSAIGCEDMLGYMEQFTDSYGWIADQRMDKSPTWPNYYEVEGYNSEPGVQGRSFGRAWCTTVGSFPPFDTKEGKLNLEEMQEAGIRSENYIVGRNAIKEWGPELCNAPQVGFRVASDTVPNHLWPLIL